MSGLLALVRPQCITSPLLLLLWLGGDTGMLLAYLWIPRSLRRIAAALPAGAKGRRELLGTASFVQACAYTHLFRALVLFFPFLDWFAIAQLWLAVGISFVVARHLDKARAELTGALSGFDRALRFLALRRHA